MSVNSNISEGAEYNLFGYVEKERQRTTYANYLQSIRENDFVLKDVGEGNVDDTNKKQNKHSNEYQLLEALRNSFARKNLIDFTIATHREYKPNWHHYLIADRLEMFARGEIKKLAVNIPPRHGKSELISRRFPGWYFGNNDYKELILISYDTGLAEDMGADARDIVAAPPSPIIPKSAESPIVAAAKKAASAGSRH